MIKFTDGKKEYIWNDNDEIIGMDKNVAEVFMMSINAEFCGSENQFISLTSVIEANGFKVLEQNIEYNPNDEKELSIVY